MMSPFPFLMRKTQCKEPSYCRLSALVYIYVLFMIVNFHSMSNRIYDCTVFILLNKLMNYDAYLSTSRNVQVINVMNIKEKLTTLLLCASTNISCHYTT